MRRFESLKVSRLGKLIGLKSLAPMLLLVSCGLGLCAPAHAITATKEYVDRKDATNAAAIAELASNVYTKVEADARIIELSPAPGDYANVSNRAMAALQSLAPATNYADSVLRSALSADLKTNDVESIAGKVAVTKDAARTGFTGWEFCGDNYEGIYIEEDREYNYTWAPFINGVRIGGWKSPSDGGTRLFWSLEERTDGGIDSFVFVRIRIPTIGDVEAVNGSVESVSESVEAVSNNVTTVSNMIPPIVNSVNTMWATMYGENVWLAVTNYMRQIQGTVPSLRLWEVRDNNTNLVYSSQEEIEHVVTQKVHTVETNIEAKITRRAWGSYQSSGEDNPSSNTVTVINSEKIMLTGGGQWYKTIETGGASVWVLQSRGVTTFGGDTNGFFRVRDLEGDPQFEVVKTADQEVDAVAAGTGFNGSGNFWIKYNATGGNPPYISCATDLADDFEVEERASAASTTGEINSLGITVSWGTDDGKWVAEIHQDNHSPSLFVHAKKTVQGVNLIKNNAPATFDGGIYINNVRYRLVPYSSGGKTYLTLEAWQ
jgi:hypothetical protein